MLLFIAMCKNKNNMCWNFWCMFFSMELGILFGLGILLFARFLRQRLYVSKSKYVYRGICGSLHFSRITPSKSCHGYCLIAQVHYGGWYGK